MKHRRARLHVKNNIHVVDMHLRLTVKGALNCCLNTGRAKLTETKLLWLNEQKCPPRKRVFYFIPGVGDFPAISGFLGR